MTIGSISDGEAGSAVRTKLNAAIAAVNTGYLSVSIGLTASQMNHLSSSPVVVKTALGAGKAILPVSMTAQLKFVTVPLAQTGGVPSLYYTDGTGPQSNSSIVFDNATDFFKTAPTILDAVTNLTLINNAAVVLAAATDSIDYGAVLTASIGNNAGLLYDVGDTGDISAGANPQSRYVVDTVDMNGAVLTFHISSTRLGSGCQISTNNATSPVTGAGDGNLTINIDSISPFDGHVTLNVVYQSVDVIS